MLRPIGAAQGVTLMRPKLVLRAAAFAALIGFALATRADAAPLPTATWVGIPESVSPAGSAFTSRFAVVTDASGSQSTLVFTCASGPTCTASQPLTEVAGGVYVAGPFAAPAPKRLFLVIRDTTCTPRYGATAWLGVWTDTGGAPFIANCFVPMQLMLPRNLRQRPLGPIVLPHIPIPPVLQRPAPIGPLPLPTPAPH